MMSMVFLNILPVACISLFLMSIVASTIWQNFVRVFNKKESGFLAYTAISANMFKVLMLTLATFIIFLLGQTDYISSLQRLQITVTILALLLFTHAFSRVSLTLDHVVFCTFAALASLCLIISRDLITIFFTLELLNMLVIYSFFFNASGTRLNPQNSSIKICASCVYQFILNFFSSIILYAAINWYISLTGGSSLGSAYVWSGSKDLGLPLSIMLLAFLLKFGSGPWIFFKVNIYRNMNYTAVFLYTVIYMTTILVFFFNLTFLWGVPLTAASYNLIILLACIASLAFSGLAFQSNNFFVFLSFSSLINITVFLLQGISVLYVWIAQ